MKMIPLLSLSLLFSQLSFAKITTTKDLYYITTSKGEIPLISVNTMIQEKTISKISLFGNANLISFATKDGAPKLYSVDEKGFTYSIEPFSTYTVKSVGEDGKFQFKEVPGRKYTVDAKGFFFY